MYFTKLFNQPVALNPKSQTISVYLILTAVFATALRALAFRASASSLRNFSGLG